MAKETPMQKLSKKAKEMEVSQYEYDVAVEMIALAEASNIPKVKKEIVDANGKKTVVEVNPVVDKLNRDRATALRNVEGLALSIRALFAREGNLKAMIANAAVLLKQ